MVGCFSGLTVSHMASLIAEKHQTNGDHQPTVFACVNDRTNAQKEELQQTVTTMGCKSRHEKCGRGQDYLLLSFHDGLDRPSLSKYDSLECSTGGEGEYSC